MWVSAEEYQEDPDISQSSFAFASTFFLFFPHSFSLCHASINTIENVTSGLTLLLFRFFSNKPRFADHALFYTVHRKSF
jgi:hypothetical protein